MPLQDTTKFGTNQLKYMLFSKKNKYVFQISINYASILHLKMSPVMEWLPSGLAALNDFCSLSHILVQIDKLHADHRYSSGGEYQPGLSVINQHF